MASGANQYQVDPRQAEFLKGYLDPKSPTYSNALQSGLKAGYSEEYSQNILSLYPDWLSEAIDSEKLLRKAEKRLEQLLDFEPVSEEGKIDNSLLANQMKAITLIAKGIGKVKYSERHEHTGKDGGAIEIVNKEAIEKALDEV